MHYHCITLQMLLVFTLGWTVVAGEPPASPRRAGPFPLPSAESRNIEVLAYDNGDASPWAEFFAFDSPGHTKLVQFRAEYKLDEVIAAAETDLERAVALKRWVGAHWKFRTPEPETFRDWSAVTLLERGKQGKWGWCGQAAILFQQACIVVGLPARFIELGNETSPACHFTTEVYLREHGKWAVIDSTPLPDFDLLDLVWHWENPFRLLGRRNDFPGWRRRSGSLFVLASQPARLECRGRGMP